jgi:hypothetical protein
LVGLVRWAMIHKCVQVDGMHGYIFVHLFIFRLTISVH